MEIAIRDTTEVDLPDIFGIRSNLLVRPHQYKLWDTAGAGAGTEDGTEDGTEVDELGLLTQVLMQGAPERFADLLSDHFGWCVCAMEVDVCSRALLGSQQRLTSHTVAHSRTQSLNAPR